MPNSWITDTWIKDAQAQTPDGTIIKISPTAQQLRNIKNLPEHFRTQKYGTGKRWQVRWREKNGRQRSKSFQTRTEAEKYSTHLENEILTGKYINPKYATQTVGEVADQWLATKTNTKGSTVYVYKSATNRHIKPKWADTPINQITRSQIQEWVTELSTGTKGKPLTPRTVEFIVKGILGAIIKFAQDENWIHDNPISRVTLPKPKYIPELPVLTYMEVEELAQAAKNQHGRHTDYALIQFLATTGVRINEALALTIDKIDTKRNRAKIHYTWTKTSTGKLTLGSPKTGKPRTVPLPDYLIETLTPLLNRKKTDWLFATATNNHIIYIHWAKKIWNPALAKTQIDPSRGITIHKLRHTAATHAISAGADIKVIQQMLGHANATETLNTYGHLFPDQLDSLMTRISSQREHYLSRHVD